MSVSGDMSGVAESIAIPFAEPSFFGATEFALAANLFEAFADANTEVAIIPMSNSDTTAIETTIFFLNFLNRLRNKGGIQL
jgi:hypothetical protein